MGIRFSFIVPIYNKGRYISECIESIIRQRYEDIEVVLIDDGSTDGSGEICDSYKDNQRVIVVHQSNTGAPCARNQGVRLATGDYVFFVDADDYIEADSCDSCLRFLNKGKPDILIGDGKIEVSDGKKTKHIRDIKKVRGISVGESYTGQDYLKGTIPYKQFDGVIWLGCYRREYLLKNSLYFDETLKMHDDMEFVSRAILLAREIVYTGNTFYHYRVTSESLMTSNNNRLERYECIRRVLSRWNSLTNQMEDRQLNKYWRGLVSKCFINACAYNRVNNPAFDIVRRADLIKYSLDGKELVKAIVFLLSNEIYYKLWDFYINCSDDKLGFI